MVRVGLRPLLSLLGQIEPMSRPSARGLIAALAALTAVSGLLSAATFTLPDGPGGVFESNPYLEELLGLDSYADQVTLQPVIAQAVAGDFAGSLQGLYAAASAPGSGDLVNCHAAAHEVGRLAAESGEQIEVLLGLTGPECNYGFLHSVVKFRLASIADDSLAAKTAMQWCNELLSDRDLQSECHHGLGHTAWARARGDVFKAWSGFCSLLPLEPSNSCVSGVSMEWSYTVMQGSPLPVVPNATSDPLAVCEIFPLPQGNHCLRYAARNYLLGSTAPLSEKLAGYLAWCKSMPLGPDPTGAFPIECVGSLGNAVGIDSLSLAWTAVRNADTAQSQQDRFLQFAFQQVAIVSGSSVAVSLCAQFDLDERSCQVGLAALPSGATTT
jgi:hypothetical protein